MSANPRIQLVQETPNPASGESPVPAVAAGPITGTSGEAAPAVPVGVPAVAPAAPVRRKLSRNWLILVGLLMFGGAGYWVHDQQQRLALAQPAQPVAVAEPVVVAAPEPPAPRPIQLTAMEVATVEPRTLERNIQVSGSLAPASQTTVNAQVGALIESVEVQAGEAVSPGDVIARLATADLESRLAELRGNQEAAQAQVEFAESNLAKVQKLVDEGYSTRSTLEKAQTDVQTARSALTAAESQIAIAEAALDDAVISAPIGGIVSERMVNPGETVASGAKIVTIVDMSSVDVEVGVPTNEIARVEIGQPATLSIEGFEGRSFEARVARINPVAEAGTRTIPVHLTLENPGNKLRGGMFATGAIAVEQSQGLLAVPAAAVREDGETRYVLAVENGALVRRDVVLGERWSEGDLVVVSSGLEPGATIIAAPLPDLQAGMPVTLDRA